MTEPADPSLRSLAELIARVAQTLQAGDEPAARMRAAADVEELRELAASADRRRAPGSPAVFDTARITEALGLFAEWLRTPTPANEATAQRAMAELQAVMGPLVAWPPARDEAAERERIRQNARSAIDDYFRANPIKPVKP